ncbi:MAG: hypothetical protein ABIG64_04255 [Candidatus Omnitrophota bacterium]
MEGQESKHDRFKRLASKRVQNAIKKIEIIGNLASPGYEYSEEDVEKITSSLQATLDQVKNAFSKRKPKVQNFTL